MQDYLAGMQRGPPGHAEGPSHACKGALPGMRGGPPKHAAGSSRLSRGSLPRMQGGPSQACKGALPGMQGGPCQAWEGALPGMQRGPGCDHLMHTGSRPECPHLGSWRRCRSRSR
eukprot:361177-Chlamydomonas_euryale.AAC.8